MTSLVQVVVKTPAYSALNHALTYRSAGALCPGTLVRVPLGHREVLGIVWDGAAVPTGALAQGGVAAEKLRPICAVLDALPALSASWRALLGFAASYYQRALGEVALAALPPQLRALSAAQLAARLQRRGQASAARASQASAADALALTQEQSEVMAQLQTQRGPFLLFGATGSGKTEVFMRCTAQALSASAQAQVLVMVPEINLTPQLEERFRNRFCPQYGSAAVVSLHSAMTPAQRLNSWLAAHCGVARIVLGTRMAVFASLPGLKLIVVDEEHDPSYKSHEGARYSARDLALYRGKLEAAKVLLGSATPSLESWYHSRPASQGGRYLRLNMPSRVGDAVAPPVGARRLPLVRCIDMNSQPRDAVIAPVLLQAIIERMARQEQCLLLLNRRGYAPVLSCPACDWKSQCPNCSAYRVFHKIDHSLRCHHCGLMEPVPRACPDCGNQDIAALGRGTEKLEEQLTQLLLGLKRPDAQSVRIMRIDADSTRLKGALEAQLTQVHAGLVDVLVGTQMIAKGHDFRRITLVGAINPDAALYSSDFRAPERLFSLLLQAAGRAGRAAELAHDSEIWLQTRCPQHPLYGALAAHDFPAFARAQLKERAQVGMPPFCFQALLRTEARTQVAAQAFLHAASAASAKLPAAAQLMRLITLYPVVPMAMARIAKVERAQMLIESQSRQALQRFLTAWQMALHAVPRQPQCKGLLRWAIDVDPLSI